MGKGEALLNLGEFALVGAGGAIGSVLRYGAGRWLAGKGKPPAYATLTVNWTGSLAVGVLLGTRLLQVDPDLYALLGTGLLGGLTTYSTFNVQKATNAGFGTARGLSRYIGATYLGGWILTATGFWLGRSLLV
jgi:CrcB protein